MFSMSEGCARPVRSFLRSLWKFSTHLPMRVAASFLMSSSITNPLSWTSIAGHDGADVVAAHHARQVAGVVQVEHRERHAVVAAHHDGSGIHHVEPVREHLVVGERGKALGIRVL